MVAQANPATRVIFIDTGRLFGETFRYRDHLVDLLGLSNVVTVGPQPQQVQALDPGRMLFSRDSNSCCDFRKVEPLTMALSGFDAWISGRKRYQGHGRDAIEKFEDEGSHVKINPLIGWDKRAIDRYRDEFDLPRHPLEADGFLSIGCMPCTARVAPGEDARSGRWQGMDKTECGIHMRNKSVPIPGYMTLKSLPRG
jgi:phosphoadenosine phosphosulfate reductase